MRAARIMAMGGRQVFCRLIGLKFRCVPRFQRCSDILLVIIRVLVRP